MRSIKDVVNDRRFYGVKFTIFGYPEIYVIKKMPSNLNDGFSDSEYCWVEWVSNGNIHGVEYDKEVVIMNFNDGSWVEI